MYRTIVNGHRRLLASLLVGASVLAAGCGGSDAKESITAVGKPVTVTVTAAAAGNPSVTSKGSRVWV